MRPLPPKPPGGPGRGSGGIIAGSVGGGPPFGRPDMPSPLGPRGPSRLPISSLVREGDRLSAPLPAVFGRLLKESGVLSRGGPRFVIDAEGVILPGGRICSRLGTRIGSRGGGGSEEYMLPGGGVDVDDGARCEKKDPCVELAVGGRLRGGGSRGNCGELIGTSPEGPLGRPGLNAGI